MLRDPTSESRGTTKQRDARLGSGWQWHLPGLSKPKDFDFRGGVLFLSLGAIFPFFLITIKTVAGPCLHHSRTAQMINSLFRAVRLCCQSTPLSSPSYSSSLLIAVPRVSFPQKGERWRGSLFPVGVIVVMKRKVGSLLAFDTGLRVEFDVPCIWTGWETTPRRSLPIQFSHTV